MIMSHAKSGNISSGSQACAACKYQRRRCAPNCPLAKYFPPDYQKHFLNAHKLFGVSNIMRILRNLEPHEKDIAMKMMIFQADVRANDPVGGCYRIICELQKQIEHSKAELQLVLHKLAICRAEAESTNVNPELYSSPIDHPHQVQYEYPQQLRPYVSQGCPSIDAKVNIESSISCSSLHDKQPFVDDIKPIIAIFDETNGSVQYSDKVVLKEDIASIKHEQEQDLKGATSLFSLTNCND